MRRLRHALIGGGCDLFRVHLCVRVCVLRDVESVSVCVYTVLLSCPYHFVNTALCLSVSKLILPSLGNAIIDGLLRARLVIHRRSFSHTGNAA